MFLTPRNTYNSGLAVQRTLKLFSLLLFFFCSWETSIAQKTKDGGIPPYDEVPIEIWHVNIGSVSSNAVILGSVAYIQPLDLFQLIKVRSDITSDKKTIFGYYIEEVRPYKIDLAGRIITYRDEKYPIGKEEIIETSTGIYLRCDVFDKVFHLKCTYNFNALAVEVTSGEPLPAESEAAAAKNRQHLEKYGEEFTPDRKLPLPRSLFSIGTLDYQGNGNYLPSGKFLGSTYGLNFGGQIVGGDFDASLEASRGEKVLLKNIPWQWRTGIENSDLISQIVIGKKATFSTLALQQSQIGIQITNAQTGYKSSFTNYTISDRTEPNWTVDLYINDALINTTKADQTGFYKFVIPLPYGSTNVVLKFHGPYGEVRIQTTQLQIPYTFLPPGHVEYTATAGTSMDHPSINSTVARTDLKFGISTYITGGGGLQMQHDAVGKVSYNPYATSSVRLTSGILLGGEYYYKLGYTSSMNISGPGGTSMDLQIDHPFGGGNKEVTGIAINDQRKLSLSTPLPLVNGAFRFGATDIPINKDSANFATTAQILISYLGMTFDVSADYSMLRDRFKLRSMNMDAIGSAGLSSMLFDGILFHSTFFLDYSKKQVLETQVMFSKTIGSFGSLNVTGSYSFVTHAKQIGADFRMNLPFASIGLAGSGGTGQQFAGSGSISGSLGFDPQTGSFPISNTPEVRHGGVVVVPFLDRNNNGKRDPGEPLVKHFGFEQSVGKTTEESDGVLRVMDLEPYKKIVMKTNNDNVENISWTPKFSSFEVTPPANGYALVEMPILVAGQIEGYVNEDEKPLGGARIKIRHNDAGDTSDVTLTMDLLTYSNGEFYYMGIPPGKYRASIDPKQLSLLHYTCTPAYIDFELQNKEEGDSIEKLNFILKGNNLPGPSTSGTKASN